jgi:hypothetical protein
MEAFRGSVPRGVGVFRGLWSYCADINVRQNTAAPLSDTKDCLTADLGYSHYLCSVCSKSVSPRAVRATPMSETLESAGILHRVHEPGYYPLGSFGGIASAKGAICAIFIERP